MSCEITFRTSVAVCAVLASVGLWVQADDVDRSELPEESSIVGTVTDVRCQRLPGAKVVVIDSLGDELETTTGQDGTFAFTVRHMGAYCLSAELFGFKREEREVRVMEGAVVEVNPELAIDAIEVQIGPFRWSPPLISVKRSDSFIVLDQELTDNIPTGP